MSVIIPAPLVEGDKIAIVSPASIIRPDLVRGAVDHLSRWGFDPVVMPSALAADGSYAGCREQRLADMTAALTDPSVRAVLCSRGGYGCVHLLDDLSRLPLADDPKWLIGFSDVSALHALFHSKGIASIHGSMAKALALNGDDFEPNRRLRDILAGRFEPVQWPSSPLNHPGEATGTLVGGNLAVLQALIATPFDLLPIPGAILFIEDIAEPIYKVERIIWQLRLAGVLERLAGLVIGQFTDYHPDKNFTSVEQMLAPLLADLTIPVSFNAPIGHVDDNLPVIEGLRYHLNVNSLNSTLSPAL